MRELIPNIAKFKEGTTKEQKVEFNSLLNTQLSSPAYTAVNLSLGAFDKPEYFFAALESELESKHDGLNRLIEMSEQILEIDLNQFLNNDTYNGLRYYEDYTLEQ